MRSASVLAVAVLLLVLACGTMTQIVALPTLWTVTYDLVLGTLFVNDIPYCIDPLAGSSSIIPASVQSEAISALQQNQQLHSSETSVPIVGNVYEGTCDAPGPLVGPISGTLTYDSGPGPLGLSFTALLVFDVGPGLMNYHSEVNLTGDILVDTSGGVCALENMVSDGSVRGTGLGGIGLNFDLQLLRLEPESGEFQCSSLPSVGSLPTLVYSVSNVAVGGVVIPTNTLAILAPWVAIISLVGIGSAVVVTKKRQP